MKVSAILLARVIAIFPTEDLNPHGRALYPSLTEGLMQKYGFRKFPQKLEDIVNPQNVIEFAHGKWGDIAIDKVNIFPGGIAVDTRSSTQDAEEFLQESLQWAAETCGLTYDPVMIHRRTFVNQLTFFSELPLLEMLHPKLTSFGDRLTKSLADRDLGFVVSPLKVNSLTFSCEYVTANSQNSPPFSLQIERRAGVPFSENRYFSSAPLSTSEHIHFLTDFEAAMIASAEA